MLICSYRQLIAPEKQTPPTMLSIPRIAIVASLVASVLAHTRVYGVSVNGVDQGDGRDQYVSVPPLLCSQCAICLIEGLLTALTDRFGHHPPTTRSRTSHPRQWLAMSTTEVRFYFTRLSKRSQTETAQSLCCQWSRGPYRFNRATKSPSNGITTGAYIASRLEHVYSPRRC